MKILVINCGSSSVKYQLFRVADWVVLAAGSVTRIGETAGQFRQTWQGPAGDWQVLEDVRASNGHYVMVKSGLDSPQQVPSGAAALLQFEVTVSRADAFYLYARVDCPSADDDSFFVSVDDGEFLTANGLGTRGWEWVKLTRYPLKAGIHRLRVAYREDGAKLDQLSLTTYPFGPAALAAEQKQAAEDK